MVSKDILRVLRVGFTPNFCHVLPRFIYTIHATVRNNPKRNGGVLKGGIRLHISVRMNIFNNLLFKLLQFLIKLET
jgi:hypothetical protein